MEDKENSLTIYKDLRTKIWKDIVVNLNKRRSEGPIMTDEEYNAGEFREGFEPQCVDAVFAIRNRGYNTAGSGFLGENKADRQYLIIRDLKLGEGTIANLTSNSFSYTHDQKLNVVWIEFTGSEPKIEALKAQWVKLTEILPDLGHSAPDSMIGYAIHSREFNEELKKKA